MLAMFLFILSVIVFIGYSGWIVLLFIGFSNLTPYEQSRTKVTIPIWSLLVYAMAFAYIIAYVIEG